MLRPLFSVFWTVGFIQGPILLNHAFGESRKWRLGNGSDSLMWGSERMQRDAVSV